jgi:hypothetical protein
LTYLLSAINALLALNFVVIVPFLGWLNYGRANWATAWLPGVLLDLVLPAGYYVYWHYWFLVLLPAFFTACILYRRVQGRRAMALIVLNTATMIAFWATRLALALFDIHPDIV